MGSGYLLSDKEDSLLALIKLSLNASSGRSHAICLCDICLCPNVMFRLADDSALPDCVMGLALKCLYAGDSHVLPLPGLRDSDNTAQ